MTYAWPASVQAVQVGSEGIDAHVGEAVAVDVAEACDEGRPRGLEGLEDVAGRPVAAVGRQQAGEVEAGREARPAIDDVSLAHIDEAAAVGIWVATRRSS